MFKKMRFAAVVVILICCLIRANVLAQPGDEEPIGRNFFEGAAAYISLRGSEPQLAFEEYLTMNHIDSIRFYNTTIDARAVLVKESKDESETAAALVFFNRSSNGDIGSQLYRQIQVWPSSSIASLSVEESKIIARVLCYNYGDHHASSDPMSFPDQIEFSKIFDRNVFVGSFDETFSSGSKLVWEEHLLERMRLAGWWSGREPELIVFPMCGLDLESSISEHLSSERVGSVYLFVYRGSVPLVVPLDLMIGQS